MMLNVHQMSLMCLDTIKLMTLQGFFHIVHYHFSERLTDSNVGEMALIYFKIGRKSQVIMWKHYAGDNRIIQSSYLSIIQYVFWQLFHNKIDYNA